MSVAYAWNLITRTEDTIKNYLPLLHDLSRKPKLVAGQIEKRFKDSSLPMMIVRCLPSCNVLKFFLLTLIEFNRTLKTRSHSEKYFSKQSFPSSWIALSLQFLSRKYFISQFLAIRDNKGQKFLLNHGPIPFISKAELLQLFQLRSFNFLCAPSFIMSPAINISRSFHGNCRLLYRSFSFMSHETAKLPSYSSENSISRVKKTRSTPYYYPPLPLRYLPVGNVATHPSRELHRAV